MSDERNERGMERDARKGNESVRLGTLVREILTNGPSTMTTAEAMEKARAILTPEGSAPKRYSDVTVIRTTFGSRRWRVEMRNNETGRLECLVHRTKAEARRWAEWARGVGRS